MPDFIIRNIRWRKIPEDQAKDYGVDRLPVGYTSEVVQADSMEALIATLPVDENHNVFEYNEENCELCDVPYFPEEVQ